MASDDPKAPLLRLNATAIAVVRGFLPVEDRRSIRLLCKHLQRMGGLCVVGVCIDAPLAPPTLPATLAAMPRLSSVRTRGKLPVGRPAELLRMLTAVGPLRTLALPWVGLRDSDMAAIIQVLDAQAASLTALDLCGSRLTARSLRRIARRLPRLPHLRHLDVSWSAAGAVDLTPILPSLATLDLSSTKMNEAAAVRLFSALPACTRLTSLALANAGSIAGAVPAALAALPAVPNLRMLRIHDSGLDPDAVAAIKEAVHEECNVR